MENIQQIVIQITSGPYERSLLQYGEGQIPVSQKEINHSDLTEEELAIYNNFIEMMSKK